MTEVTATEEKKEILLRILERHPQFRHPIFHNNLEHLVKETVIHLQEIEGEKFTNIFLTYNAVSAFFKTDSQFFLEGTPRFFKSIVLDSADHIISIGFPHFFSLENFADKEQFSSFRFVEKHDGTCLLITRWKERYLVRSRRKIYYIKYSLEFLNFSDYPLGNLLESLFLQYPDQSITVLTEATFPSFKATEKLSEFYTRVMRGAGFCPFVEYPNQNNFLTGIIFHDNIHFEKQSILDKISEEIGIRRPKTFQFVNLDEASNWVKRSTNHEGFCVYFNDDQTIFKFKTDWYIRVRSTVSELYHLLAPVKEQS